MSPCLQYAPVLFLVLKEWLSEHLLLISSNSFSNVQLLWVSVWQQISPMTSDEAHSKWRTCRADGNLVPQQYTVGRFCTSNISILRILVTEHVWGRSERRISCHERRRDINSLYGHICCGSEPPRWLTHWSTDTHTMDGSNRQSQISL